MNGLFLLLNAWLRNHFVFICLHFFAEGRLWFLVLQMNYISSSNILPPLCMLRTRVLQFREQHTHNRSFGESKTLKQLYPTTHMPNLGFGPNSCFKSWQRKAHNSHRTLVADQLPLKFFYSAEIEENLDCRVKWLKYGQGIATQMGALFQASRDCAIFVKFWCF